MKKLIWLLLIFILMLPSLANAETPGQNIKAAFIRDGSLWTKINGKEEKVAAALGSHPEAPQWSNDGKWILYTKELKETPNMGPQKEIWVYNMETKKHKRISYDGRNPKWSPVENNVAFQINGVLNVSNLERFYNVAIGVDDYNWFPDGSGFIASASAVPQPDEWTNPKLYKITLEKDLEKTSPYKNVTPFYVIPKELKKGNVSVLSINATNFSFSPDSKWISFIVSQTASLAMDSDMVCVISADGKHFEPLDEVIFGVTLPQWAASKNWLGYIAGGGRIVFGFKNKKMKVTELPAFHTLSLTPPHFAELGFTWKDDQSLYVSRVKESEWSNSSENRPDPSLFLIKIKEQTQIQITHPPKNYGDYRPQYLVHYNKITWLRKKDIADSNGDLWIV